MMNKLTVLAALIVLSKKIAALIDVPFIVLIDKFIYIIILLIVTDL